MSIVTEAIAQRAKLQMELLNNPVYRKIKMLDEIIATFDESSSPTNNTITKKDQIHQLAKDCIGANGGHAKLAVVHEYITRHGVKVHIGMLKSYMYKYGDLKSSRPNGFSLKK